MQSSFWKFGQLFLAAQLSVACFPQASSGGTANAADRLVPLAAITEAQDEWLHAHCAAKKVFLAWSRADGDRVLRSAGANFGELVSDDGSLATVAFACPVRPDWSPAAEWVSLASVR